MPYAMKLQNGKWRVYNKNTGDTKGTHATKEKAQRQINLLRGVEHGWKPTGQPARK